MPLLSAASQSLSTEVLQADAESAAAAQPARLGDTVTAREAYEDQLELGSEETSASEWCEWKGTGTHRVLYCLLCNREANRGHLGSLKHRRRLVEWHTGVETVENHELSTG